MQTKDGVEFQFGMTLINEAGGEIELNDNKYELIKTEEESIVVLTRKEGVNCRIFIGNFYSNQQARINNQIAKLENMKVEIDKEIIYLKQGAKPYELKLLNLIW